MTIKNVSFVGTPSGDGECFCFNVTEAEYIALKGEESHRQEVEYRKEMNEDCGREMYTAESPWRIYPDCLFGNSKRKLKVTITIEELPE
jgi:hypothetical protein